MPLLDTEIFMPILNIIITILRIIMPILNTEMIMPILKIILTIPKIIPSGLLVGGPSGLLDFVLHRSCDMTHVSQA